MMNSLSRWIRSRPGTMKTRGARRKNTTCNLYLEALEDRLVPTAIVPPSGMVSWWAGDNTGVDLAGANNATLYGATYDAGKVANGFKFDGIYDNLQAPSVGLPTGSANRTMELWARIDQPQASGEDFFASYGKPGSTNQVYALGRLNDGRVFVSTWGPAIAGGLVSAGSGWHHIAATNVGTSFNLYLDGVNVASGTLAVATPTGSTLWMGRDTGSTYGDSRRLNGMVDEVTVYNRALSAAEIQAIYNAGSDGKIKPNYVTADLPTVAEPPAAATSNVTFAISRGGDLTGQATVNWTTADGTATAGTDYIAASGQVIFNTGESQKTVSVTVIGNGIQDPSNKTFQLVLSSTDITVRGSGLATILEPTSIQGAVFNDANHNGVLDAGESGIAGWTVYLDVNQNGIFDSGETFRTTDASGNYFFDTTTETPALVGPGGELVDYVSLVLQVGTGGRYLDTTPLTSAIDPRATEPHAVRNFGTFFQPPVGVAPAGSETLVNATTAGGQSLGSVSADAAGNYVVAWGTLGSGGAYTISARVFNANGSQRTGDIIVTTSATISNSRVAMAGNGRFMVTWYGAQGILTHAFDSNGTPVGSTATVLAFDANTKGSLGGIAADSTGDFVVAYNVETLSKKWGWSTPTIYAQRYTSSGSANGGAITAGSTGLINGVQSVAMDGAGNFVVVWDEGNSVSAQRIKASGQKNGPKLTITAQSSNAWLSNVSMNSAGQFAVAWFSRGTGIMVQRYNADATPSGVAVIILVGSGEQQPGIALDAAGNVTLAGTDGSSGPGGGDVHMRRLAAGATAPEPETIVNTTTQGPQLSPGIAPTGNGSFIVAWQGYGPGDDAGIFSQRYGQPQRSAR